MDKKQLINSFSSPSAEYRGKPFWSWNGELRKEELVRQAHIMKEMGLGGYFMHSRTGLITEYLGDEWFKLINDVADAAEADGMEAWLYDEDRWPSGSAGGMVSEDPQYRMKSLYVFESDIENVTYRDNIISLCLAKIDGIDLYRYKEIDISDLTCDNIKDKLQSEIPCDSEENGTWKALVFAIVPNECNSNYNGNTYIDTMSRKATDRFIELTHEKYAEKCGDRLGRSIKGIFSDEPHRGKCLDNRNVSDGVISCAIAWTDDIFEEYEKRYGSDIRHHLPELFYRKDACLVSPFKLHYIDLACNLFVERFIEPINKWCEDHGIIYTGHVLHEDSLMSQTAPNGSLMRTYEHMTYPGIDCLSEHNRCYWIVKQLSSVTRQMGKKWLLSELYGCTGWQFDFKGHKAVGDWQALFGINLRCQHLSWYTMEGESKRDYPASILHQSPWYHDYSKVEDYFARMGLVISEGDAMCDVLLLNPIESLWCQAYLGWASWIINLSKDVEPYERRYAELFHYLAGNQIDFDYGEEYMMEKHASVECTQDGCRLRVGRSLYKTVIVSNMLTIRPTTMALLKEFAECGGKVIFAGDAPGYIDAVESDEPSLLAKRCISVPYSESAIVDAVRGVDGEFVSVTQNSAKAENEIFVQARKNFGGDGIAVVVLNTNRNDPSNDLTLSIKADAGYHIQEWDLENGERYNADDRASYDSGIYTIRFDLYAAGTICFVLTKDNDSLKEHVEYETVKEAELRGEFKYTRKEENVCVLDYCRWRWLDGEWHDRNEVLRADREIRTDIGIELRGGEMLQPWFSKTHDKKVYGEIELSYEFYIDTLPSGDVYLAGERPELNRYSINGTRLENHDINDFWIDDCFKKMKIPSGSLHIGKNEVRINVSFMRTTNVEAIYLIGDFGVKTCGNVSTITYLPTKLGCDDYAAYNMPFYTGDMTFELEYDDYKDITDSIGINDRIVLTPNKFTGGCVKVCADGNTQILGWDPYEADVTDAVRKKLPIYVTVEGVRTNTFGPLHEIPKPAANCGPGNFVTGGAGWSDSYSLLSSGLRGFIFKSQKKI